ncbi:hypothetical protein CAEBREN_05873 [Caenorhabditis brenneri]|uniref:B box-type domain-containing protein n=1 Tax=Caenorhabditis brenneri TaxID=135651 RepID=G0M6U4_CAEBE|nr:hypothetical protein CAEBREN_05873 [Caenorhabditis brenneri]
MDDSPFRACSDRTLLFERLKQSTRSITMLCSLEGYPIRVFTEGLPPGFSMESPPVSKKEFDIIFEYNPIRSALGVVQGNHVGKNVVLRVEYLKGDCSSFSIYLGFKPEKDTPTIRSNPSNKNDNQHKHEAAHRREDCKKPNCGTCLATAHKPITMAIVSRTDFSGLNFSRKKHHDEACSISSLPTNRRLLDMLDELEEKTVVDVSDPVLACFENSNHDSECWCAGCQQPYCKKCFIDAHKVKKIADHKHIPLWERPRVPPKCPLHPEKDAIFVCLQTQCPTGHQLFCIACQKAKKHHLGHSFEDLQKCEYRNTDTMVKLMQPLKEVEQVVVHNLQGAMKSRKSFEKDSGQADAARNRIKEYYRKKTEKDLEEFEKWREERREKESEKVRLCAQNKKRYHDHSKRMIRKVCRRDRLYDLEDIVERSEELIKKSREENPQLQDYISANGMELEPPLLKIASAHREGVDEDDDII